jgi:tRNA (guanine37-N1)-methyltransferase
MKVPEILLSGDQKKISKWQREQALIRTLQRRPDLLKPDILSDEDIEFLRVLGFDYTDKPKKL